MNKIKMICFEITLWLIRFTIVPIFHFLIAAIFGLALLITWNSEYRDMGWILVYSYGLIGFILTGLVTLKVRYEIFRD